MGMIKIPKKSIEFFKSKQMDIFDSGNLAESGWNKKLSEQVTKLTKAKSAAVTNSNGSGLLATLLILKTYFGKKSIVLQSNTMFGMKVMAQSSGLDIKGFVDCRLSYLMPSFADVEKFFNTIPNKHEFVFLLTHIGGWSNPEIEAIANYCEKHSIALIEDCAHSLGTIIDGQHTGTFGLAGVYSFYATKAIPAGEGGVVVSNSEDLMSYLQDFLIYDRFKQAMNIGVNFRMSELNALFCFSVLREADNILSNKHSISRLYEDVCNQYGWGYIKPVNAQQISNLYKFILISDAEDPESEFSNIRTRTSSVYDYYLGEDPFNVSKGHICLPIWYGLEADIVEQVVNELKR